MIVANNTVVSLDFTLRDDDGTVIDTSDGTEPLEYLHGHGQIVEGLERALEGRSAGEQFAVVVAPADGYGVVTNEGAIRVPLNELPEGAEPEIGMEIEAVSPGGESATLFVLEVSDDSVLLGADHPLAGVALHFDVRVLNVRAATKDEIDHGHAHSVDGHAH